MGVDLGVKEVYSCIFITVDVGHVCYCLLIMYVYNLWPFLSLETGCMQSRVGCEGQVACMVFPASLAITLCILASVWRTPKLA